MNSSTARKVMTGKQRETMKLSKFDIEVQARTWVMGAAVGLACKYFGWQVSDQDAVLFGVAVGSAYDFAAYQVKKAFVKKGDKQ